MEKYFRVAWISASTLRSGRSRCSTRFALPEITIGVFPPLASTMFPHIIGPKRALELVLTGEAITAERARDLGLVNRLEDSQEGLRALIEKRKPEWKNR